MNKKLKIIGAVAAIVIAVCIVWFATHDYSGDVLRTDIEAVNQNCPFIGAASSAMSHVSYDQSNNKVVIRWDIPYVSDMKYMANDSAAAVDDLRLLAQEPWARKMLGEIVDAKAVLRAIYKPIASGSRDSEVKFTFSTDDVAAINNEPMLSERDRNDIKLRAYARIIDNAPALRVSKGISLTGAKMSDDMIVLSYEIDDPAEYNDLKRATNRQKVVKSFLKEQRSIDNDFRELIKQLASTHQGITYVYQLPESTDTFQVIVSDKEVYNISTLP